MTIRDKRQNAAQEIPGSCSHCAVSLQADEAAFLSQTSMFLSLLFRYPDKAVYKEVMNLIALFSPLFRNYLGKEPEIPSLKEIQSEYVSLFVNNCGYVPAVPYASYYIEPDRLLFGKTYTDLKTLMHKQGFVLQEKVREAEDHLYLQLEFASQLIQKCTEQDRGSFMTSQSLLYLLQGFILPTIKGMNSGISSQARYDFYPDAADLGSNFLQDLVCMLSTDS